MQYQKLQTIASDIEYRICNGKTLGLEELLAHHNIFEPHPVYQDFVSKCTKAARLYHRDMMRVAEQGARGAKSKTFLGMVTGGLLGYYLGDSFNASVIGMTVGYALSYYNDVKTKPLDVVEGLRYATVGLAFGMVIDDLGGTSYMKYLCSTMMWAVHLRGHVKFRSRYKDPALCISAKPSEQIYEAVKSIRRAYDKRTEKATDETYRKLSNIAPVPLMKHLKISLKRIWNKMS